MEFLNTEVNAAVHTLIRDRSSDEICRDESFWERVRREYEMPSEYTHLEFGYYHPAARGVIAAEIEMIRYAQRRGSFYKRGDMERDREMARRDLARIAGASPEEIVVTRNATEAMNIIIQGIPLKTGDEIIHCDRDYPSVVEALEQRARRDGLKLSPVSLASTNVSDANIVDRFSNAIGPRTRALLITHVINLTGQVLPLRELCALGRRHNLHVIVDAAHSFAQLDYSVGEVGCDYLGASLHKWLGAPLGTGLLYVKRDRISELQPLFADTRVASGDIRKLEHFGNRPDSAHVGLRTAIAWHEALGVANKQARLRYLQQRWTRAVREMPNIVVLTPPEPNAQSAIGAIAFPGRNPFAIAKALMDRHQIFVNGFEHPAVSGVRVTPGLPTSVLEIDRLIEALRDLAKS